MDTMTIDGVFTSFPDEWVLLDQLETGENSTVVGGRVVAHDTDRMIVEATAIGMGLDRCVMVRTKMKDGKPAIGFDLAVSPITSSEEIRTEVANRE